MSHAIQNFPGLVSQPKILNVATFVLRISKVPLNAVFKDDIKLTIEHVTYLIQADLATFRIAHTPPGSIAPFNAILLVV